MTGTKITFCAAVLIALAGSTIVGSGVASGVSSNPYKAHPYSSGAATNATTLSPVGTWTWCRTALHPHCTTITWTFTSGGGWSSDFQGSQFDTGSWIQQGDEVSVAIQTGVLTGCVFLGRLHMGTVRNTINTANDPGPYTCPGGPTSEPWYAHQ